MLLTQDIINQRIEANRKRKYEERLKRKEQKIEEMLSACEDEFVSKLCNLFINRWDCYAVQDNENPLLFPTIYKDLTIDIIKKSIDPNSDITIGIHQINNNKIKWLCYDIDKKHTPDTKLLSDQIIKYLKEWYNLTGYLEPSGSPDSYHIWVFTEPTEVDIALNFHKVFKDRLKYLSNPKVNVKAIEKVISRGYKNLGCMIKLPFNIQRKTNIRSELLTDILTIEPEKIPIIQESINQKIENTMLSKTSKFGGVFVCRGVTESVSSDIFEDIGICGYLISRMPNITTWLNVEEPDRSVLDFMIIKALVKIGISKKTIHMYLSSLPSSKTRLHDRGDDYFNITYNNVLKDF
jgi:hypothetical protein